MLLMCIASRGLPWLQLPRDAFHCFLYFTLHPTPETVVLIHGRLADFSSSLDVRTTPNPVLEDPRRT